MSRYTQNILQVLQSWFFDLKLNLFNNKFILIEISSLKYIYIFFLLIFKLPTYSLHDRLLVYN